MHKSSSYLLLLPTLLSTLPSTSQKKAAHQQMLWIRYAGNLQVSEKWDVGLEVEDRRFAFPDRQQYWLLPKISVSRQLPYNWSATVGFIYYLNSSPSEPKLPVSLAVPEWRPFQQMDYRQKLHEGKISHRFIIEERLKQKYTAMRLLSGIDFYFRCRYRLQWQYPLMRSGRLSLSLYDEILLNFGHTIVYNTFDQNRVYAGLCYSLSRQAQLEAGYLYWFQQKAEGDRYLIRDVLRLTFHHNLSLHP